MSRVWIQAPRNAVGKPVAELLEHPLLRLAREMYPGQPVQCKTMLEFFRGRLRVLDVRSENHCPASETDLLDWIAAGLQYGALLKEESPDLVEQILEECGDGILRGVRKGVRQLIAKAGGLAPARLLPQLKLWQKTYHDLEQPRFYGEELARVVYFADFAVWIPWTCCA